MWLHNADANKAPVGWFIEIIGILAFDPGDASGWLVKDGSRSCNSSQQHH